MKTIRLVSCACLLGASIFFFTQRSVAAAIGECDPDDITDADCGPSDVCNPGTLLCDSDCNHGGYCPPARMCPVSPSGCVPIN